jgi:hypothetical protein
MASSTKKITGSSAVYDSGTYTKQTWTETSAAGANTYAIQQDATSVKLKLTGATGDIVRIGGLSAEYQVKFTNKTLTLTSDTQKIVIAMNSSAVATISFLDGSTTINAATRTLGTQKLKTKLADITTDMNADSAEALATADYFSDATYTATVTATAVTEGQDASFVIKLDKPATSDVLLNYSTQSGTATSNDFAAATGSVIIRAGQTSATVNVTTNDDAVVEQAETLTLRVSGQQLTAPVDQTVTVNDNDTLSAAGSSFTTAPDSLKGSDNNDTFRGVIFDNSNTFQSGDKVDGGAGTDTLSVDIGNSQRFAITAETQNVENVVIRAQAMSTDSTDNNTASTSEVQIDAERMVGVNYWESNNSRADLLIEDVRILPTQITKDITIAMVETDPGHVDYGFYFDQYSLRSQTNSSSTLTIELADTRSLAAGTAALKDNPYWGFKFLLGGVEKSITSDAIDNAQTYPELLSAVQAAIAADSTLTGITASLGAAVNRTDTISGQVVSVTPLILNNSGTASLGVASSNAWLAKNGVPASSGLHTNMSTVAAVSTEKVTSKVILDDVGRGSTGGDLVIGGLSVGDTSTSLGVERFEIEVRDNSKLQTINSTNNTLQEVTIKNGLTSSSSFAYVKTVKDSGNLTVNGDVMAPRGNSDVDSNLPAALVSSQWATSTRTAAADTNYGTGIDTALPGSAAQHNAYGFSDVRLIDGSTMTGNLAFTAEVTTRSIAKYMNVVDTQANPASDALNGFGTGSIANFDYKGGNGNDTMVVDINSEVAGTRSTLVAGREDFTFGVNGGAGNDEITLRVVNKAEDAATGAGMGTDNWYDNQDLNNNISVWGGAGNDTIRTPGAGDVRIDAGADNDTIYTDNTGLQANVDAWGVAGLGQANAPVIAGTRVSTKGAWVFNTADQVTAFGVAAPVGSFGALARDLGDLRSDLNNANNFYNSKVTVTFKGLPAVTAIVAGTNFKTTDLELNQAIKNAINNDAVLNKLLVAEDGPANTLVVKSLIDGVMTTADLGITVTNGFANSAALPAGQLGLIAAAYGLPSTSTADAVFTAMTTTFTTKFANNGITATNGDYVTALANDSLADIMGRASVTASDNVVLPGTGNDVVVLGTTLGANVATSSNETVVIDQNFGTDTIVNFAAAGNGQDFFDFTALKGTSFQVGAVNNVNNSINVGTVVTSATVTEQQAVQNFFATNSSTTAQDHVFVAVDPTGNTGTVYMVNDPAGTNNAIATKHGVIDLATTPWASLTAANFVNSSTAGYNLLNGPTTLNGTAVAALPTATLASSAANINEGGSVTYTATLTGGTSATALSIPYTLSGTGITPADFGGAALTGNINIAAGATTGTLVLNVAADALTEGAETATITLGAVAGVTLGGVVAQSTLINDTSLTGAVAPATTTNISGALLTATATAGVDTFNIATGTYAATIAGFNTGDKLVFFPGASITVVNDVDQNDGIQVITAADTGAGTTTTITLTGLTAAQDLAAFNTPSFNNAFGPGSLA